MMVVLQKKAPQNAACPTTEPVAQGPPIGRLEPLVVEEASPSQGLPIPPLEAPNPESADPGPTVHGMMVQVTQMVDLMLMGPLASLCKEEGLVLQRCFTEPPSPK